MIISWTPIIVVDILGSIITLALALSCTVIAHKWTQRKADDIFRHYIFLLTLSIVFFAISRSFGHIVKQLLIFNDMGTTWQQISPFSGAINTVAFVVIFAISLYFHRFQKFHSQIEAYKNNLEEMIALRTVEIEETNIALSDEIIEHNMAARALKESQSYLQAILDHTTLPMYIKDINGKYLLINKVHERITQYTNDNIAGKSDYDVFPKSVAALFQSQDTEVQKKGVPVEFEETISLHGKKHTYLTSKFPLFNDGKIYAIGGVCTDITNHKRAEAKLAAEQERLAVTLRSIGDGVVTTDTSGNIVLINKVAEKLTGWLQEEANGKPFEEVFHLLTPQRKPYPNPIEIIMSSGDIFTLDEQTILINKQGDELIISDSGAPIRAKDSTIIGVVLVFRDVTLQLKLEAESLKIKKLESVGILAGGIAHDFNNILSAILGNINLAKLDNNMEDETQKLLTEAEKATLRASSLTRQLLTFSKGGAPVKETASLQEIIQDSANFVLHGEKVACEYDFANDLYLVDVDKGQISQVVQNIIINAYHAMINGGVIKVKCENEEGLEHLLADLGECNCNTKHVKIIISDNGSGISAKIIDKIFDPYFSTKHTGSGLGLTICHSIVSKHNGTICVESNPEDGTTFTITLPASIHNDKEKSDDVSVEYKFSKSRILIMDDEEMVLDVAGAMLSRLGHDVVVAKNGKEAVSIFRNLINSDQSIDLTIMDLTIPGGMGGEEAVQEFIKIDPEAKVVVSSGYSTNPIMANYKRYGFCAAIIKPYRLKDLTRMLGEALSEP